MKTTVIREVSDWAGIRNTERRMMDAVDMKDMNLVASLMEKMPDDQRWGMHSGVLGYVVTGIVLELEYDYSGASKALDLFLRTMGAHMDAKSLGEAMSAANQYNIPVAHRFCAG